MTQPPSRSRAISRRDFMQRCALGAVTLAAGSLTGCTASRGRAPAGWGGAATINLPLDAGWLFSPLEFDPAGMGAVFDDSSFQRVTLPHCVSKLSWQGWETGDWRRVWNYRRHFSLPEKFRGKRVFLNFEGVMRSLTVAVNGHELEPHHGGYLPARFEITEWLTDGENVVAAAVDGRTYNVPPGAPDGSARIDFMEPAGIHRPVQLVAVPQLFVSDVFAKPVDVLGPARRLDVECTLDAAVVPTGRLQLRLELFDGDRVVASGVRDIEVAGPGVRRFDMRLDGLAGVQLWDVDSPKLYRLVTTVLVDGRLLHDHATRVGFREARFKLDGFFLNGRRLQLFGLNRHELFPYRGFAMPERVHRRDAEILKRELNLNMVRCAHYPQSDAFLDACDELGLLVWEEIAGWQYVGDEAWKDLLVRDVREMVIRGRNRPSIVVWGTRPNETRRAEDLFSRAREMANSLDGTRLTSGALTGAARRAWENEWREELFAYNDYNANPDGSVRMLEPIPGHPYLVTETVGQFNYTTGEKFDSYYRRSGPIRAQMLQALRHAQAHDRAGADPRYCGVIAWCAFEYGSLVNAHNAVKYPGVVDVFRIPKLGAAFYLAQREPSERAVIEPNFYWDFGPETPRGPGKGAAIFSNCERLEIHVGGRPHASLFPDRTGFPNIRHAPFFVDLDLDGKGKPELRVDGYVGERLVLSRSFSSDASKDRLFMAADDRVVVGDGVDATRVQLRIVDEYGAPRAHGGGEVQVTVSEPGELIGDNAIQLDDCGGAAAIWVRSKPGSSGPVTVSAVHSAFGESSVELLIGQSRPSSLLKSLESRPA